MSDLYDTDLVAWSRDQAELLRRVAAGERINNLVDWANIIEEVESLGRTQEQELANRISTILEHLMRLQASPASDPRRGWRSTIVRTRAEIARLLKGNKTLRESVPAVIAEVLPAARDIAAASLDEHGETPTVQLDQLSYSEDQVIGPWLPE